MGISEIERKLREKRSFNIKSIELRLIQLLSASTDKKDFKGIIEQLVEEFGSVVVEDKTIINRLKAAAESLKIESSELLGNIIFKEDIFEKSIFGKLRVNHRRLGLFLFQRAKFLKKESGGIFSLAEILNALNDNTPYNITSEDVLKAVKILENDKIIPGMKTISSDVKLIQFLPFELSNDHKLILQIASEKGWVSVEEASKTLNWSLERLRLVLDKLAAMGIAKPDPTYSKGKRYYFPALVNR